MVNIPGIILLIISFLLAIVVFIIAREEYQQKVERIQNVGLAGFINADFFRFIWFVFTLTASFGFFIASRKSLSVLWRWVIMLILIFVEALFLFSTEGFELYPYALIANVFLTVLLIESIYYFGLVLRDKLAASLIGFLFFWSIFGIYFIVSVLSRIISLGGDLL